MTAEGRADSIGAATGKDSLAFFDAIAPIIYRDTIDMDVAWMASRWHKVGPIGDGKDYINCPLDKDQYYAFVQGLVVGVKTGFKEWVTVTPSFEGSMQIEVMTERGTDMLRVGPMTSVGLSNPR